MPYLVVDTSTKLLYVAVASDKHKLLACYKKTYERDHARHINVAIYETLVKAKLQASDLKYVIVGSGPGSYTGLRVAGTAAKVLAYTLKVPLYEVSSMALLTSGYNEKKLVIYDARNNRFFASLLDKDGSFLVEPKIYESSDLPLSGDIIKIDVSTLKISSLVKVDFLKIDKLKTEASVLDYVPNYCLKTKAERSLNDND